MVYTTGVRARPFTLSSTTLFFIVKALDELEYGLGVERGWLLGCISRESEHFGIIWEESEYLYIHALHAADPVPSE